MEETACWTDKPADTTVATTGVHSVPLKTTGHEKDHFTVVLTARADGKEMKLFVVFNWKGTHLTKDLRCVPGIIVHFSANGWMNDALTTQYLHSVISTLSFTKHLLIWDAYHCYTSIATGAEVARKGLHTAIAPGGCTNLSKQLMSFGMLFEAHPRSLHMYMYSI